MYFSSIIAISKTRVCFEAFKPTQENIRMCFFMSRKNKQGCPQLFISRAGLFDILLWGGNACNAG